jgi:D-glycero-D-manno-heptose 1,7-bisphosphate phosphatase
MNNYTAVVLAGGKGTRLGSLTKNCPKPLLKINNEHFLNYLLFNIARHGFKKIIIVAGYQGKLFKKFHKKKILNTTTEVFIEKKINGTLGALNKVRNKLKSDFFIFNGDTFYNFNYLDLIKLSNENENKNKKIFFALKPVVCKDVNRYNAYKLNNNILVKAKKKLNKKILVSGGVIFCKKSVLNFNEKKGDIEEFFFSQKKLINKIFGKIYDQPFIDIGLPKDFYAAKKFINKNFPKISVYFDRDGVLNKIKKKQYIKKPSEFIWINGAKKVIKYLNDNNFFVFIITNQAGIAKGYIKFKDYQKIEEKIHSELCFNGSHIDKIYHCPFHKDAIIKKYKKNSFFRKPNPGMIFKSFGEFPVIKKKSLFIGDQITDQQAANKANLKFLMFKNKNLFMFMKNNLRDYF